MKWLLRAALWFAFGHALITACGDAAVLNPRGDDEEDETGGTRGDPPPLPGGTGGRTGTGGSKTSPPVPSTGGRFGAGGSPVPGAGGSPEACAPPTTWSLDLFCGVNSASCNLMNQSCAPTSAVKYFAQQGCGYINITQYDQTGRVHERVFDQFSSRMVYYSITSDRCGNVTQVGSMPNCFSWTQIPCGSWLVRDAGTSGPVADAPAD